MPRNWSTSHFPLRKGCYASFFILKHATRGWKYGLTHLNTERSMVYGVLSLAGYSIRRGLLSLSRD